MSSETAPLVVAGDVLLDRDVHGAVERVAPDAPVPVIDEQEVISRPGGAGLAATLAARDGRDVVLVTAIARDDAGEELRRLLSAAGVEVIDLGREGRTVEKVRIIGGRTPIARLDRGGGGGPIGPVPEEARRAIATASAVLVSDYGRGITALTDLRDAIGRADAPVVWDPHPRGNEAVPGVRLLTPNRDEARRFAPEVTGTALAAETERGRMIGRRWGAAAVALTLGARGALLLEGDAHPMVVPAPPAPSGDPCGAGDRFAATAAGLLADGRLPSEAVVGAVTAASAFVASGGARAIRVDVDVPPNAPADEDVDDVVARVRSRGGTVVATGGCFDLLHAGHVDLLEKARSLGDCLVVCLNSDASVRRLKGPGRPVVSEDDRAAVLLALGSVDAVAVFSEDTPAGVLERLRPDIWVKGADYAVAELPEADVLAEWGGQAVVLPYLEGRSTTRILEEVLRRAT